MDTTRLENLINDLFSLEVNTIVKQGMMATKMPNAAHALIDLAIDYSVTLCRLGAENPMPGDSEASYRVFHDIREVASKRARVIQGLSEDKELAKTQMPKALSDRESADVLLLCRIRDTCDQLKQIFAKSPGGEATRFDRGSANDFRPEQLPLTDRQRLVLRKAWELGTEVVVLQTSVTLDGDVVSRIHPDYAEPEKRGYLEAHQRGVDTSIAFWKTLVGIVRSLFGRA
ncbi:MAG TPA: hypothetical protein VFQ35_17880 [Polyangiaceae bacterium]|nr:hypothetical protein [Polyangiaceae bacterium]